MVLLFATLLGVAGQASAVPDDGTVSPAYPMPGFPPEATPPYATNTCWWGPPVNWHNPVENQAAVETNVMYYFSKFTLPANADLEVKGEFPHSRFFSFQSYKTVNGEPGVVNDVLFDKDVQPDPLSRNPFQPGVPRNVDRRFYTVKFSQQPPPPAGQPREKNTLYVGTEGQVGQPQEVQVFIRVYLFDRLPVPVISGQVSMPKPAIVYDNGQRVRGNAACQATGVTNYGTGAALTPGGFPNALYIALRNLGGFGHPAEATPVWNLYFNTDQTFAPFFKGTPLEFLIPSLPTQVTQGFYANAGNRYIYSYLDRRFGPDPTGHNIAVVRAKMPTHPDTVLGQRRPMAQDTEVRYASMCNDSSLAIGPPNLFNWGVCVYDEQMPVDRNGYWTIVVSLPEDRPANATKECGVIWMDWGRLGDWLGNPNLIMLLWRNQLSNPDWEHNMNNITVPGTEKAVLGPYYPDSYYTSKPLFDQQWSCNRGRAGFGPSGL